MNLKYPNKYDLIKVICQSQGLENTQKKEWDSRNSKLFWCNSKKRWVVKRTFSWLQRKCRRLFLYQERLPELWILLQFATYFYVVDLFNLIGSQTIKKSFLKYHALWCLLQFQSIKLSIQKLPLSDHIVIIKVKSKVYDAKDKEIHLSWRSKD